jgi:hypothetical protein
LEIFGQRKQNVFLGAVVVEREKSTICCLFYFLWKKWTFLASDVILECHQRQDRECYYTAINFGAEEI